jgi:hypothetical protein
MKNHLITFVLSMLLFPIVLLHAQDIVPEKLGENVNTSAYSEVAPVISPDGRHLYFVRKSHPENTGGMSDEDDIWYSSRQSDGSWGRAVNIGRPLNNDNPNGIASITPDGNRALLLNRYNAPGPGLAMARRMRTGWDQPVDLTIDDYINRNKYTSEYLCTNGTAILLSLENDKSLGDLDLFVTFKQSDGTWSSPRNLGPTINTVGHDGTPFMASDNTTLYFASDGHGARGGDIFMSRRLDDTWQNWSPPVNLGPPINTGGWDAYLTIPANGEIAYFVRDGDIYKVILPEEVRPLPVALIKGRVLDDRNDEPIQATIRFVATDGSGEGGEAISNPGDGSYQITVAGGREYKITTTAAGYRSAPKYVNTSTTNYEEIDLDLPMTAITAADIRQSRVIDGAGDRALLFMLHGLSNFGVGAYRGGIGLQYYLLGGIGLRASFSMSSDPATSGTDTEIREYSERAYSLMLRLNLAARPTVTAYIGPFAEYRENDQKYSDSNTYLTGRLSKVLTYGVVAGAEWFAFDDVSLSAEYHFGYSSGSVTETYGLEEIQNDLNGYYSLGRVEHAGAFILSFYF